MWVATPLMSRDSQWVEFMIRMDESRMKCSFWAPPLWLKQCLEIPLAKWLGEEVNISSHLPSALTLRLWANTSRISCFGKDWGWKTLRFVNLFNLSCRELWSWSWCWWCWALHTSFLTNVSVIRAIKWRFPAFDTSVEAWSQMTCRNGASERERSNWLSQPLRSFADPSFLHSSW